MRIFFPPDIPSAATASLFLILGVGGGVGASKEFWGSWCIRSRVCMYTSVYAYTSAPLDTVYREVCAAVDFSICIYSWWYTCWCQHICHLCICICMYVCMYIYLYVYMYIHIYVCLYILSVNNHTDIYMYIHAYIRIYIHTYVRTYIHAYIHTCMHTYIHTCIHI
jgi:hypothetical protein